MTENLEDISSEEFWNYYKKEYIRDSQFYCWKYTSYSVSILVNKIDIPLLTQLIKNSIENTTFEIIGNNIYDRVIKKTYVLSIHSDVRSNRLKESLLTLGINTEIVFFSEEDKPVLNNLLSMFNSSFLKYSIFPIDLKKLALLIKIHKKEFYQNRNVMILYDDIVLCKNFGDRINTLFLNVEQTPWDAIYLGERYTTKTSVTDNKISAFPLGGIVKPFDGLLIKSQMIKSIISTFELTPNLYFENQAMSFKNIKTLVANFNLVSSAFHPQISHYNNGYFEDVCPYFKNTYDNAFYEDTENVQQANYEYETLMNFYKSCLKNKFDKCDDSNPVIPKLIHKINLINKSELTNDEKHTYELYEKSWLNQNPGFQMRTYTFNDIVNFRTSSFPRWEHVVTKTRNPTVLSVLFGYIKLYEHGGISIYDNTFCHTGLDNLFSLKCQAILTLKKEDSSNIHQYGIEKHYVIAKKHSEFLRALIYHIIHYINIILNFYKDNYPVAEKVMESLFENGITNVFYRYWLTERKDIFVMENGNYTEDDKIRYSMILSSVPTPIPANLIIKNKLTSSEIDIFLLVRNNGAFLKNHFWRMMTLLEKSMYGVKFNYYIFENDSVDDTLNIVNEQKNQRNINLMSTNLGDLNKSIRTYRLGIIRNQLSDYMLEDSKNGKTNADLVLLIDTDVIFTPGTIHKMISSLLSKDDAVMIGSHCLGLDNGYYDTLALELGKYHLTRPTFLSHLSSHIGDLYKVSSCFGGICLTYKYIFKYCHFGQSSLTLPGYYSNITCEHYNFCRNIKSFGNIYICKSAISYWVQNWLNESSFLLDKLRQTGFYTT